MTKHYCQNCHRLVCKESSDPHYKHGRLKLSPGTQLQKRAAEAPRIKCSCGQLMILLKGSVL